MKSTMLIGLVLIALGIAGLVAGRVSFTTKEKVLDLGPIEATAEKTRTIGIPDVAGIAALAAGVVLVVVGTRRA
jgi:hypothetical protein